MSQAKIICPECAKGNGSEWKEVNGVVNAQYGPCDVCKDTKVVLHVGFWKNLQALNKRGDLIPCNAQETTKKQRKKIED